MTTTVKLEETTPAEFVDTSNFPNNIFISNLALENFHKICRFCLSFDNIKPFFPMTYEQISIQTIIFDCTLLKLDPEDHMPDNLCEACLTELIRCYKFKNKCIRTTSILRDAYNNKNYRKHSETVVQANNSGYYSRNLDDLTIKTEKIQDFTSIYNGDIFDEINTDNLLNQSDVSVIVKNEDPLISDENLMIKTEEILTIPEGTYHNFRDNDVENVMLDNNGICQNLKEENCELSESETAKPKRKTKSKRTLHNRKANTKVPIHTNDRHNCGICKKSYAIKSFSRHMAIHTGVKTHTCSVCKKSFNRKTDLRNHMFTHTGKKPHECSICSKTFTQLGSLKMHMRIHTGDRPFKCGICKMSFVGRSGLNRHNLIHMNENPYQCSICKKSFARKYVLKAHMLIHVGDRDYECSICKKSFIWKQSLNKHMRNHTGKGGLECGDCKKSFTRKESLNRHMKTHTGEGLHNCSICLKSFTCKFYLKTHMLIHTGEKRHECSVCMKSFLQKSHLKKHALIHVGNESVEIN